MERYRCAACKEQLSEQINMLLPRGEVVLCHYNSCKKKHPEYYVVKVKGEKQ